MTSITCPFCARVGSTRKHLPPGAWVRCPGCNERFEVSAEPEPDGVTSSFSNGVQVDESDGLSDDLDLGGIGIDLADPDKIADILYDPPPATTAPFAPWTPENPIAATVVPVSNPVPPEPNYYRWLDGYARVCAGLARFVFYIVAVMLGMATLLFFSSFLNDTSTSLPIRGSAFVAMFWLLAAFLGLFPFYASCLLLRLAVDVARNIRALRYN